MSLRWWMGLLVAAAVVAVPTVNLMLLSLFPPPPVAVHIRSCAPDEAPDERPGSCVRVNADGSVDRVVHMAWNSGRERVFVDRGPAPGQGPVRGSEGGSPPAPSADGATMTIQHLPGGPPPGTNLMFGMQGPALTTVGLAPGNGPRSAFGGPPFEFKEIRAHFLWINLASLGIVVLLTTIAFSMIVRWPVRGLLTAIEDIEHGGLPAAGGMTAPSELRQIGGALHRLARQLRSSTQERELMLAGMSHDLRSPLARIQAAIELRARPDEDWRPVLRDVREIDHIVGQCIDFVRDGQDEPTSAHSLDELVRGALRSPDDDEVELDLAAPQILKLRRQSMMRVLRNLLNNAEVHGSPPLKVITRSEADAVTLTVEDHGRGIATDQWELLLKPFAQGSRARNPGGAGLGLAIVQRIVALHGGTLQMRAATADQPFAISLRLPML